MVSEFKNESLVDFSQPENEEKMKKALAGVASALGRNYPLVIAGDRVEKEDRIASIDPSRPDQVVGYVARASSPEADRAVAAATEAFASWKKIPAEQRAQYLFKAASALRERRLEFSAWMVYEVGKSWVEADADVAEAIDFLEFYGREVIRLSGEQPLTRIPSEKNELRYIPLGVAAVIPPWNFPMAIMVGMTSAAFVSGNTVILKPSSDAPVVAAKFVELLEEVGLPRGW